jgi:hypothetical protein
MKGAIWFTVIMAFLAITSCKKLDFSKSDIDIGGGKWLYYDDGRNFTGISANSLGNFDIAIRFSPSQLTDYDGFEISQVRFYPLVGNPATYSVTLWKGFEPPYLIHVQPATVEPGKWNTENIDSTLYVDASSQLWVGIKVQNYPAGSYPAGVDEGPANAGRGDLYSINNGVNWYSLYYTDGINYNWNLQVLLNHPSGKKTLIVSGHEY